MIKNNNKKIGTFDIETDGLLDTVTKIWCCVIKNHDSNNVYTWVNGDYNSLITELNSYDILVGHNCIAYDFPVFRKLLGWEYNGTKIDTLIMSRTQRPSRKAPKNCEAGPHSVEAWGIRLGHPKVENNVWTSYSDNILTRCKEDVEIQYKIYQSLLEEGRGEGWEKAHRLNNKLFDLLQRQEEYGWIVDINRCNNNIRILHNWINRIDRAVQSYLPLIVEPLEIKKDGQYAYVKKPFLANGDYARSVRSHFGDVPIGLICGPFSRINIRPIDLDSTIELKDFLLNLGWKPAEWNVDEQGNKRSPKFSKDDPFDGIQGSLGRLIARRIQCKQRLGILEGWKSLIRADGRISCKVGGIASTGRLRHKDVVNVPSPHSKAFFARQMREIFKAKDGWKLCGVDSKGNQVRQLAARMDDDEFTRAVLYGTAEEGTDLHSLNQRRSGAPSRSKAKNFFYGFIFGAGARKISTTIGISVTAAKALIEKYLSELPKLKELINKLTIEWKQSAQKWYNRNENRWVYTNGKITGLDGRPVWIDSEHKILCYALQSDEAIQMAAAYVKFHHDASKAGYILHEDWGMLIWMHDEFQFECKPEIAEALCKIGCDAITWAGKYYSIKCPHEGEYKIGSNWSETH